MKKNEKLKKYGPWALVTGASSGIGKEFATQLASIGMNVILVARRKDVLEQIGHNLSGEYGIRYQTLQADLSQIDGVDKIIEFSKGFDIGLLVSNAGAGKPSNFLDKTVEDLIKQINLNSITHMRLVHHFAPIFEKQGKGGIVLVGAMGASEGIPYMANESGTKAYLYAFGQALHQELKGTGIDITVLETSPTETPVLDKMGFTEDTLPMKPISTKQCVSETLNALVKNQAVIIPGRKYRILNRFVPSSFSRKMMSKQFKKLVVIN